MTERRFFRLTDIAEKLGLDAEELRRRVADVDGFGDWLNRIEATLQALERQLAAIDTEIAVMRTTLAAKRLGEPQRLTESERR
jgi:hypothetical protein